MCWALSLNWISIHRDRKIGSTAENQKYRVSELKKIAQRAVNIQNYYQSLNSDIGTAGFTEACSKAVLLIKHFTEILKLNLNVDMTNLATDVCLWQPGNGKLPLDKFTECICPFNTVRYNVLVFWYKTGDAHAMATYHGGNWFTSGTVLFDSNVGDIDEANETWIQSYLESHNQSTPIKLGLALRITATSL